MFGGSSRGKSFGTGRGKGGRKGDPIVWEGSLGPESFGEAVFEFPVESKYNFTKDNPLRGYDARKEDWPKCMHGEDCLVQMMTDEVNGGRRFFKCPLAWSCEAPENCGFVRWVDPPPIHPHQDYINYLQNRIFELEREVSSGNNDHFEDDSNNSGDSQKPICTDVFCKCPYHKNSGPPPPPSPPH